METLKYRPTNILSVRSEQKSLTGTETYPVVNILSRQARRIMAFAPTHITTIIAPSLAFRLHNNSKVANEKRFGNRRPASAYFTVIGEEMIIEWGEIDPSHESKLHSFLNRSIDFNKRVKNGGVVRSGHIGVVNLPTLTHPVRVALIDAIKGTEVRIARNKSIYPLVVTMLENNILPISSDGFPISVRLS